MDLPGLNFQPGLGVQSTIWFCYGETVNFFLVMGLKEFFLIASFGPCKFCLNELFVGLILQATLGGGGGLRPILSQFKSLIMIFCFVVASKNVGFHIYNLRSFACEQYHIFFNLWGNGGTNWVQEFRKYLAEEDDQWTLVHRKKSPAQKSFRDVVKDSRVLSRANSVLMGRMNQQSKQKASMHRSVFYRNEWNSQNHQKDHFQRNSFLVFDRLECLRDSLDH
jgi:hypothetical protein